MTANDAEPSIQGCDELREHIVPLTLGELGTRASQQASEHLVACAACAEAVERERRLVAALRALPPAPTVELVPPALPTGRVHVRRFGIAAAAAVLAAAAILGGLHAAGHLPGTAPEHVVEQAAPLPDRRITVRRVVDGPERLPVADEGLLALTAGIEAVAVRRPVTRR